MGGSACGFLRVRREGSGVRVRREGCGVGRVVVCEWERF